MKVLHVITALNFGGAEAMLAKLVAEHREHPSSPDSAILSLLTPGTVGDQIAATGVPVETLHLKSVWQLPGAAARLAAIVRRYNPDLVQGWMYHGNVAASFAAKVAAKNAPLLWNIRHSLNDLKVEKPASQLVIRLGALLSGGPQSTIYNSETAVLQHAALGYDVTRAVVIPNGFNHHQFRPDGVERPARAALCRNFDIDPASTLVAVVARHHPMKDHATAIESVGRARQSGHDVHLLLAGSGTDALPPKLMEQCRRWLPHNRLTMLGDRRDISEWLPGCDIVALSSAWGEGFPNILGEAMASGVPCITTDVGDSRKIIGDAGICVPLGNPAAMAAAITELVSMGSSGRQRMGSRGRARVQAEFSLPIIARRYADLYEQLRVARTVNRRSPETPQCAG